MRLWTQPKAVVRFRKDGACRRLFRRTAHSPPQEGRQDTTVTPAKLLEV